MAGAKKYPRMRDREGKSAGQHQRRHGDPAGFSVVTGSPGPGDQRRGPGADRHQNGLHGEEHPLAGANGRQRLGAELTDELGLHHADDR